MKEEDLDELAMLNKNGLRIGGFLVHEKEPKIVDDSKFMRELLKQDIIGEQFTDELGRTGASHLVKRNSQT